MRENTAGLLKTAQLALCLQAGGAPGPFVTSQLTAGRGDKWLVSDGGLSLLEGASSSVWRLLRSRGLESLWLRCQHTRFRESSRKEEEQKERRNKVKVEHVYVCNVHMADGAGATLTARWLLIVTAVFSLIKRHAESE